MLLTARWNCQTGIQKKSDSSRAARAVQLSIVRPSAILSPRMYDAIGSTQYFRAKNALSAYGHTCAIELQRLQKFSFENFSQFFS